MSDDPQDNHHWEPWQKAYRFGVILILPPEPLRTQVNALRERHDPKSHACCQAHISLTVPIPRALTEADWGELRSIAARVEPLQIRYGPLKHYLPHPGVALEIAPQVALDELRAAIESARAFADAPPRKYPFSAHMTIAEFITADETPGLMERLEPVAPAGAFTCDSLSHMVPNRDFCFTERATLRLRCPPLKRRI